MITKISFVGILVRDIEEAKDHFIRVFGLKPWDLGIVEMPGVKAVMFPLGGGSIELLQPTVGPDAPVGGDLARRLEKYGEGVCRLGLRVDNLDREIKRLKDKGFPIVDTGEYGKIGEEMGARMAFVHPKATHGVLIELDQTNTKVVSTVFKSGKGRTKLTQEQIVGRIFAKEYEKVTGIKLCEMPNQKDPPDLLFKAENFCYGVELVELGQFYNTRALADTLTNSMYEEFENRGIGDLYLGIGIELPLLLTHDTAMDLKRRWKNKGIRNPIKACARELADFLAEKVPSPKNISESDTFKVDSTPYPALAELSKWIGVRRCAAHDERRSDKRAAPLIIVGTGYLLPNLHEAKSFFEAVVQEKIVDRSRWSRPVDRAILIVHDLPRKHIYEPFSDPDETKKQIALISNLKNAFDEVWTVRALPQAGKQQAHRIF